MGMTHDMILVRFLEPYLSCLEQVHVLLIGYLSKVRQVIFWLAMDIEGRPGAAKDGLFLHQMGS